MTVGVPNEMASDGRRQSRFLASPFLTFILTKSTLFPLTWAPSDTNPKLQIKPESKSTVVYSKPTHVSVLTSLNQTAIHTRPMSVSKKWQRNAIYSLDRVASSGAGDTLHGFHSLCWFWIEFDDMLAERFELIFFNDCWELGITSLTLVSEEGLQIVSFSWAN